MGGVRRLEGQFPSTLVKVVYKIPMTPRWEGFLPGLASPHYTGCGGIGAPHTPRLEGFLDWRGDSPPPWLRQYKLLQITGGRGLPTGGESPLSLGFRGIQALLTTSWEGSPAWRGESPLLWLVPYKGSWDSQVGGSPLFRGESCLPWLGRDTSSPRHPGESVHPPSGASPCYPAAVV